MLVTRIIWALCFFCALQETCSDDWIVLFDGSTTEHWRAEGSDLFPAKGWTVDQRDKALVCQFGGNLVTRELFSDFELRFEFRINPGGNSGIFYRYEGDRYDALEYQILDDLNHEDGSRPERSLAALYDVLAPKMENKSVLKPGNWNTARIVAIGSRIEHWLNGKRVLQFDVSSKKFQQAVQQSKFNNRPDFARNRRGYILLQDHRDVVSFRRIYIRPLTE